MSNRLEPSATTVRDPEWTAAEIRYALAETDPLYAVRELAGLIQVWSPGADQFVQRITDQPGLPPIRWHRYYDVCEGGGKEYPRLLGEVSCDAYEDVVAVAQRWAFALGLPEVKAAGPEWREWATFIEGWYVELFADLPPDGHWVRRPATLVRHGIMSDPMTPIRAYRVGTVMPRAQYDKTVRVEFIRPRRRTVESFTEDGQSGWLEIHDENGPVYDSRADVPVDMGRYDRAIAQVRAQLPPASDRTLTP